MAASKNLLSRAENDERDREKRLQEALSRAHADD